MDDFELCDYKDVDFESLAVAASTEPHDTGGVYRLIPATDEGDPHGTRVVDLNQ